MQLEDLKKWVGKEFSSDEFEVKADDILAYAKAAGETEARFTDPNHPDFQAPPTFTARFMGRRTMPMDFPRIGRRGFDAGKSVTVHAPVRPGHRIVAHSRIAEVYEKTGRSGPMVFIVHRMEFTEQSGELLSVVDWRMVQQPDPDRWQSEASKT